MELREQRFRNGRRNKSMSLTKEMPACTAQVGYILKTTEERRREEGR
jgi:hypothetical protein